MVSYGITNGGVVAGTLEVDGTLKVITANNAALQVTGSVAGQQLALFSGADTATTGYQSNVAGDSINRFRTLVDGTMSWGPGNAGRDTNLYRSAAATLKTDNNLAVGATATVTGIASLNGGTSSAGSAPALTPTFANGTAAQLTDVTRDYMVYLNVGTPGTGFTLQIGPTAGVANTVMASATPQADQLLTVRLPAGWFLKWAGTSTTMANQLAIGC